MFCLSILKDKLYQHKTMDYLWNYYIFHAATHSDILINCSSPHNQPTVKIVQNSLLQKANKMIIFRTKKTQTGYYLVTKEKTRPKNLNE